MSIGAAVAWAVASFIVTGAAAVAAKSLREFSRFELEEVCRRRRKNDGLVAEILLGHQQTAVAADALGAIAAAILLAALAALVWSLPATEAWGDWARSGLAVLAGAVALCITQVWLPSAVVRLWAAPIIASTWRTLRAAGRLLAPVLWVATRLDALLQSVTGHRPAAASEESFEGEIRTIVTEGHREGLLEEDAREMIEGVIQLGDAEVSEVMTPRTYMLSMNVELSLDEAVKFVISSGHTRIPVFDKNRDNIVGILHLKDLLPELVKPPESRAANLADLVRPAHFVPETKRLDALLQEFQRNRNHMAVVLDEYAGVSGLVTIEDVLEEIVGEIVDEYDEDLVDGIKTIDQRTAEALARVRIDEVNERLGIQLPEDGDFDTIGGFVFSHLGHIPSVGEEVLVDDVRLTVVDVTRRRIERVRIEVLDPSEREMA